MAQIIYMGSCVSARDYGTFFKLKVGSRYILRFFFFNTEEMPLNFNLNSQLCQFNVVESLVDFKIIEPSINYTFAELSAFP